MNSQFALVLVFLSIEAVHLSPIQDEASSFQDGIYGMRLAKRGLSSYRQTAMNPFNFRGLRTSPGQRKKAVDETFIRFGRMVQPSGKHGRNQRSLDAYYNLPDEITRPDILPELLHNRFLVTHSNCRISSNSDLLKVILNDPECFRATQLKGKRENVSDTFIRFGKREAPPEKEFETANDALTGTR